MFKRDVSYTDYNGVKQTETFYFHISEAELIEMEVAYEGGFGETLQKIIQSQDRKAVIAEFKKLILLSIGQKSEDGKRFVKTEKYRDEFEQSAAYSSLFMDLALKEDSAAQFINELMPTGIVERLGGMVEVQAQAAKILETSPTSAEIIETAAASITNPTLPPPPPNPGHSV